ncbi:sphinganine C4-monooxygenase 1-like [Prunus yedoensis var. nudiflora]|uniref:Sphinganine C4-monooxygenase 1-like n=1 Tax=Prunus yedoensis var. nudiflora TaxID=2094558 RepID=A0A314ZPB9_PRUYE|nr:sphinganine C4-monooxygenase 1-like [Prunus yedoensis var. nudiflora]PQQ20293.1 sphinganine C4-monooxygenase 1-like [Prunus yedoensis var. nudiflora]
MGKISDEVLGIFVPIFIYWIYAGILAVLETAFPKYKIQTTEQQDEKNLVSRSTVIKGVLVQQSLQAIIAALLFMLTGGANPHHVHAAAHTAAGGGTGGATASACRYIIQFATAMLVMDTWQYFMHRYMHQNKFLYKYIHSHHHTLLAPYAFGALYNHPLEGLMFDTMGGGGHKFSGIWNVSANLHLLLLLCNDQSRGRSFWVMDPLEPIPCIFQKQ